jgi:hypothetical protein
MSTAREKGQADFDLERFIDMFDEALTSKDERVVNALRSLMMMVILTKPETRDRLGDVGPLRQIYEDMHNLNRRVNSMEEGLRNMEDHYRRQYETRAYSSRDIWDHGPRYSLSGVNLNSHDYKVAMESMLAKVNKPGKI